MEGSHKLATEPVLLTFGSEISVEFKINIIVPTLWNNPLSCVGKG